MTILSTFLNELFPFARLLLVNRRVAARLADETPDPRQARWAGLGREKLLALLAEEWDRAKALDEKLFKQTAALSLAVRLPGPWQLLGWQIFGFGAYEATVPAEWCNMPRPWKYVLRIQDGASVIELSGTVPPGVGPGQKFTHMAPPPPPARRSWWFFGSPPPPLVPVKPP